VDKRIQLISLNAENEYIKSKQKVQEVPFTKEYTALPQNILTSNTINERMPQAYQERDEDIMVSPPEKYLDCKYNTQCLIPIRHQLLNLI
jgi:uncharacterized protein YpiB (UPF0302 family)